MATELLRPNGAGDLTALTPQDPELALTNWECVAESSADDLTYVSTTGTSYLTDTYALENHAQSYGAVNSVTVYVRVRKVGSSTNNQCIPVLRLGGTTLEGSQFSITTSWAEYSQTIGRPGGGSWTASDIDSLQAGVKCRARGVGGEHPEVSQVWIVVDYTLPNHPAPTNLECERATNPTTASDDPVFSAVWQAGGGSGTATHAYIQVSEVADFATTKWDSGWIDIADISHNTRCALIDYAGADLSSDPPDGSDVYYWRIKFKDGSAIESNYSSNATFKVTTRAWWNRNYAFRQKLLLNASHGDLPADTTLRFNIKTGNRVKIATNASFNEGIQEAGYMIAEFANRAHVVYLSRTDTDGNLGIYIQSYDKNAKVWGTPYRIDDAKTQFDTHFYPTLCIDNNGIIHVFYGCHGSACYYRRSTLSNQSGSFAGDGGGGAVWTSAQTIGSHLTYPQAFVVPSTNRIVLIMRSAYWNGSSWIETKVSMFYSTDSGASWSSEREIIYETGGSSYRIYCYGVRFDPKRERVHLGFSFIVNSPLNMTKGVWYAYADFESGNADGFAAWKTISGSSCGTTSSSPITMATAGAVRLNDTGDINIFFCRCLALNNAGEPLVFWATAPWYLDAWGQESAFGMSRWNGSSWVHSNITEDNDVMMRTDRAGLPTLVDVDGVIHTFTAIDSVVDKHHKPTSNGTHTNVSVVGAGANYQAVDDGISFYDADDTYIGKTTDTGEASFASSATLPSGVAILSVGVEVVIRDITGGASFAPFLRISGTDYAATAITGLTAGAGYVVKRAWWDLNPATSAAWLKAAAEGAEFGIKQTVAAKSWRCTRINRLVKVRHATSAKNYATEVGELTSNDSGATWKVKRITDNSAIGVPILSIKHHYTNRQIELVWVSGGDLFYLDWKGYGRMRNDARDLRIVWQAGASATELHRIIDYANLENTLVEFKIPEAIASSKIAGSKDIYVYSGYADVADDPLSDPNEVYPLMFENFETLAADADINGQNGWTVNSGTGSIYASPPNHNNKVFAGANALKALGTTFEQEKSFSPALADVAVDAAIWIEVGAKSYLQAVNASSAVFAVGINASTGYACYQDGSGWHDHATVRALGQNMCTVRMVVNASGCSAWVNGQQICNNITAITSISKIKLGSASQSYFDMIKISRWYATNPVVELQAEETSGFTFGAAVLGKASDQITFSAKVEGTTETEGNWATIKLASVNPTVVYGSLAITPATRTIRLESVDPVVVKGSIAFAPVDVTVRLESINPAVVLSSITVTPPTCSIVLVSIDPVVIKGSISIGSLVAEMIVVAVDPAVLYGSVVVAPAAAGMILASVDPAVIKGSIAVSGTAAMVLTVVDPAIGMSAITITPAIATIVLAAVDPVVVYGSLTISGTATVRLDSVNPAVLFGSTVAVPAAATMVVESSGVVFVAGSLALSPATATIRVESVDPAVLYGSTVAVPEPVAARLSAVDPNVGMSSVVVTPAPATIVLTVINPVVLGTSLELTPDPASLVLAAVDPVVVAGSIALSPVVSLRASTVDPAVIQGSIVVAAPVANVVLSAVAPSVILPSITISSLLATIVITAVDPIFSTGSLYVTTNPATMVLSAINPAITMSSIAVSNLQATIRVESVNPAVGLSSMVVSPAAAAIRLESVDPAVGLSSLVVVPSPASIRLDASATIWVSDLFITPEVVSIRLSAVDPLVFVGQAAIITPNPASILLSALDPVVKIAIVRKLFGRKTYVGASVNSQTEVVIDGVKTFFR